MRVSGPIAHTAVHAVFRGKKDPIAFPRLMIFGNLIDYESQAIIDTCLCVFMPSPHSFTGEDTAEFQLHGSPLLIEQVLRSLFSFGVHPAEPGEFTKRAFLNGKVDLLQAEAIADVINASSDRALKIASEQLQGSLSQVVEDIGESLKDCLAELEAGIDFPEEDIEPESIERLKRHIVTAVEKIENLLSTFRYGKRVKDGFRVLLYGAPNVGKSSLLNILLGRNRAIVTSVEGTTRDLLEEQCTIGGYTFVFCDSAGIRDTNDEVEQIGVALTKARVEWADLILLVADATDTAQGWKSLAADLRDAHARTVWMVINKIDLNPSAMADHFCESNICQQNIYLSAKTRNGFSHLTDSLIEAVKAQSAGADETGISITNERQRNCLYQAKIALERVQSNASAPAEIIGVELRLALAALAELVGKTTTEDILGRIFSKFCVGK